MRPTSRIRLALSATALAAFSIVAARPARGFEELTPNQALGMGGASRAWAVGDAGPLLNPSGMTLGKAYTIEGMYSYATRLSDQFLHASIVDSTSPFGLAGGLYYTYHTLAPSAGGGHGHEGGLALALPFGPYVSLGGTIKYFALAGGDAFGGRGGGLTFDVGATVRPAALLSLAIVGSNLRDLGTSEATQTIGYGAALVPRTGFLVALDGLTRLTRDNQTGRKGTSVMGGASYTFLGKLAVRAGGGYDAATGNGYASFGLSGISEIGAFDGGIRQDLSESVLISGGAPTRETVVGISLRLFIPAAGPEEPSSDLQDLRAPVMSP